MTATNRLCSQLLRSIRTASSRTRPASRAAPSSIPRVQRNAFSSKANLPPTYKAQTKSRILLAAFAAGGVASVFIGGQQAKDKSVEEDADTRADTAAVKSGTKFIRLADVKEHDASSGRPWVTQGTSVYDITDWVGAHPGGEVILRAAGGSLDPYWDIFTIHKRKDVYDILEQYKIGEIDPKDLVDGKVPNDSVEDPFVKDPARDPRLKIITARACNAETPSEGLTEFLTPNELFYIRNHMWVPVVEEPAHQIAVELPDGTEKTYTMADLKSRFKQYRITATLQCAGNRRKDMTDHARQTNGLQWTAGAISSAEWEGPKLRDVLADAGLDTQDLPDDAQHAQFMGLEAYGASIPMDKVVDPSGDVILAHRMNGADLPRDHGFPIRVIVPGNVAARSVKWLRKITVSDEESPSQWQRRDYKCFGPNVGPNPDWSQAKSIQEMPVTSAITAIKHASRSVPAAVAEGETEVKLETTAASSHEPLLVEGYAYSGGGREIIRVDVSTDNGKTWDQAQLLDDRSTMHGSKAWCWKRWRYKIPDELRREHQSVGGGVNHTTVLVKATDDAYNTQPESYESIYNVRGNLATAWHRVSVDEKVERS
jgi:sulfite oxidase